MLSPAVALHGDQQHLISKPAAVVQNGNVDHCVLPGCRNNSFRNMNESYLCCYCVADERVKRLSSVYYVVLILLKG